MGDNRTNEDEDLGSQDDLALPNADGTSGGAAADGFDDEDGDAAEVVGDDTSAQESTGGPGANAA